MAKATRYDGGGRMLHVIGRCVSKELMFPDDNDAQLFWSEVGYRSLEFGVQILAMCLLGNHYHLIVRGDAEPLAETMHRGLSKLANVRNKREGRRGALVGRRYTVIHPEDAVHVSRLIRYVPMNPVRHKLAQDPAKWVWSTHAILLGHRGAPEWFDRDEVLRVFGFVDANQYERFVLAGTPIVPPPMTQLELKHHRVLVMAQAGLPMKQIVDVSGYSERHVLRLIAGSAVRPRLN
jgi:REP element-mobilizing transposase RayT